MAKSAEYFDIEVTDLTGKSQHAVYTHPRQIAMWLCRRLLDYSYPHIANHFNRDHTTVMHAVKIIAEKAAKNHDVKVELQNIVAILHGEEQIEEENIAGQIVANIKTMENQITELSMQIQQIKENFKLNREMQNALERHRKKAFLRAL